MSRPDGARRQGQDQAKPAVLRLGPRTLDLRRVALMGVLNVTPDSFSDGGRYLRPAQALDHAAAMVEEGAAIVDVGGESTRPGAEAVATAEEVDRVVPVIERLARELDVAISIDTTKPEVMRAAVEAGAVLINDVMALRAPGALETAAVLDAGICLMHMKGQPRTMQGDPQYRDVVAEVRDFLGRRVQAAEAAGIARDRLLIDPGFGFGKTLEHNLQLLRGLGELAALQLPILAGLSRKSMIGMALDLPVERRLHASVALAQIAVQNGARIVRVHDVGATRDAIRMWETVYP
jgi:dihydropteroate synthase